MDQLCRDYRKAGRTEEAFSLYQQGLQTPAGADEDDGRILEVQRILNGMEGCPY